MYACPACFNTSERLQANLKCEKCGWTFIRKQGIDDFIVGDEVEIEQQYIENYEKIAEDDINESIQAENNLRLQNTKLLAFVGKTQNLRVCEVGVGKGLFLTEIAKQHPAELYGVDISTAYLKRLVSIGTSNIKLIRANAEALPFFHHFDIIVSSDVIKHVFNIGDFLVSMNRSLVMGGTLVLKMPYEEDITSYAKSLGCKYAFVHLRSFDKKLIKLYLKSIGFEVSKIRFDGFYMYRKRKWLRCSSFMNKLSRKVISKLFDLFGEEKINDLFGNFFFMPTEMTVKAKKCIEKGI